MASTDQRVVNAIVAALPEPHTSELFPAAVARLFGAHLTETEGYRGSWVDDLENVRVAKRLGQVVVLADCNWQRGHGGEFFLDPCMAIFELDKEDRIPYTLFFAAEERPTRLSGGHIRKESAEDWTWLHTFTGALPVSPNTSLERTRDR